LCALQSFRDQPFRAATLPPLRGPRLEFAARSEFGTRRVSPVLVGRLHFAVGLSPAVWFFRDGHHRVVLRRPDHSSRRVPRSSRVSFDQSYPGSTPGRRYRDPLLSFRPRQHIPAAKVHVSRDLPARCVPPSGFGYPLDGLLPSQPVRACFIPAALMGLTPFGVFSSRKVSKAFRPAMHPRTVSRAAAPLDESSGRTDAPRSLGFDPCRSPLPPHTPLSDATASYSPGLCLSKATTGDLESALVRPTSSHVLGGRRQR
jgi:hypothetical protein